MKTPLDTKSHLHPRNKHRKAYDFNALIESSPELVEFVSINQYGNQSVDFFNPAAVRALNRALLRAHYEIDYWRIPEGFLCPPIPGRVDYIHYLADLLGEENEKKIPKGNHIKCLDIGTGASIIYPLLGHAEYAWSFVGTDIEYKALKSAKSILRANNILKSKIELRAQKDFKSIFKSMVAPQERFELTLCNPPFHSSAQQATAASARKTANLKKGKAAKAHLNFGGQSNELWCKGGEYQFIKQMITESKSIANNCLWFTSLVSKKENLKHFYKMLEEVNVADHKVIEMRQGQKISRVICWTFLPKEKRLIWKKLRWK